jgi:hypothetical protein
MTPAGFEQATQQASGHRLMARPLGHWDRPSLQMLPLMFEHEVLTFSTRWHESESNDCVNVGAGLLWTCQHVVDLRMKGIFRLKNYGAEKALGR